MNYKITLGREWYNLSRRISPMIAEIGTELDRTDREIASTWVQKLKQNAPKFSTFLMDSIELRKVTSGKDINKFFITVEAPYALFQETGVTPHFVHRDLISPAGYTFGDWMDANEFTGAGMWVGKPGRTKMGAENKFFTKTAYEMESIIDKEIQKLFNKVRKTTRKK